MATPTTSFPTDEHQRRHLARELRASRRFSQNFLLSEHVLSSIADACAMAGPGGGLLPVVEIGPGLGFLTNAILGKDIPSLDAIELDRRMVAWLEERVAPVVGDRFRLHPGDVLKTDWAALPTPAPFALVGNLPYAISAPILMMVAGELYEGTPTVLHQRAARVVFMFQKEVADKLLASPGQKAFSTLTLTVRQWFDVEKLVDVPPHAFYPAPDVQSTVVTLTPRAERRFADVAPHWLDWVVHAAFTQKRKTLWNNLKNSFLPVALSRGKGRVPEVLRLADDVWRGELLPQVFEGLGYDTLIRAEQLDWDQWTRLTQAITTVAHPFCHPVGQVDTTP